MQDRANLSEGLGPWLTNEKSHPQKIGLHELSENKTERTAWTYKQERNILL